MKINQFLLESRCPACQNRNIRVKLPTKETHGHLPVGSLAECSDCFRCGVVEIFIQRKRDAFREYLNKV